MSRFETYYAKYGDLDESNIVIYRKIYHVSNPTVGHPDGIFTFDVTIKRSRRTVLGRIITVFSKSITENYPMLYTTAMHPSSWENYKREHNTISNQETGWKIISKEEFDEAFKGEMVNKIKIFKNG